MKIFPGYTAKYEALLTVNQAMIDYGGVKNILDVTYVDILGQSKGDRFPKSNSRGSMQPL